ncbi:hypothetical protein DSBG_3774 [Desulfosporosinus sp. BG]|nr:hypothetical protein DSBG_3774 [Desulfosporosinus sp. BG]
MKNTGTVLAWGTLREIKEQSKLVEGSLLDCFDKLLENS